MANQYYLMSQLPAFSINAGAVLPFTEEYFVELCSRFLDKKSFEILQSVSLEPPRKGEKTGSLFVDSWNDWERNVRLCLAQMRAQKLQKDFTVGLDETSFAADAIQIARTASGFDSPLEAEEFLNSERVNALQNLTPLDGFSRDAVFAYALKLKLAIRIKKFNEESGMDSYRKIYDTILGEST